MLAFYKDFPTIYWIVKYTNISIKRDEYVVQCILNLKSNKVSLTY